MKLNGRLLPWFIAAELSVIIVFVSILILPETSDSFLVFTASIPFLLAFGGKCAEIKGYHPKVMPLIVGIPAIVSFVILILGIMKDVLDPPLSSANFAAWYFSPFLIKTFVPSIIISVGIEVIILIKRKRSGYSFDETDTAGVLPCIIIVAATAFICWFSAYEIRQQITMNSHI
ncbi:MAG: hypothetical protein II820_01550 [Ruminiclostridium sp.]|nr:hypothetical protein [Ruminiclostridium sp.]